MPNKTKNKINRPQAREAYAHLHDYNQEHSDFIEEISEKLSRVERILYQSPPWALYYEIHYSHIIALFFILLDLQDELKGAVSSGDGLNHCRTVLNDRLKTLFNNDDAPISDEDLSVIFCLIMAINTNIKSLQYFAAPLSHLIHEVKNGSDTALFDAVLVDRTVLSSPTVARCIQISSLANDETFFDSLSKAVKGSRPRRPDSDLDDTRFMVAAIDEMDGLDNITRDDIYDFLSNDLQIYSDIEDSTDPRSSLKKLIYRRKYKSRT